MEPQLVTTRYVWICIAVILIGLATQALRKFRRSD